MTLYICWKNTPLKMLESYLRSEYVLITGEHIQEYPVENEDETWLMVGSSRVNESGEELIRQAADRALQDFKNQGYAQPEETLDDYFYMQHQKPEWWVNKVTE